MNDQSTSRGGATFRSLGLTVAGIAAALIGVALLRPSAPQARDAAKPALAAPPTGQTKGSSTAPKMAEAKPDAKTAPKTGTGPAAIPTTAEPRATVSARRAAPEQVKPSMKIQQVTSPGGIKAWLVEEHSVPLLAVRFSFDGGSSQDPAGKEGVANFLTAMMDEGAGDLDHTKYQERMEELAMRMSFTDDADVMYGSFETLTANRDAAVDMLRLAITKPRFDQEAVERIRKQLLSGLAFAAKNPDRVVQREWSALAFKGHSYGRPANGTPATVAAITRDDLVAFRQKNFARDTLHVGVVGDISAAELGVLLDRVFGDLPAKADITPVGDAAPDAKDKLKIIEMDVPQSVVRFGMNALPRKDKDFMAAYVLNQILGGGGFASRLMEEVREKRGLAYSVYSYIQPMRRASIFAGGVATKNEAVAQSIDVIKQELTRMAADGPSQTELDNAKSYLTGSFPLQLDTNAKIANRLLWMQLEDTGIDYIDTRNAQIDAVTLDDVKRVAKRLLKVDDLIITVVGKPKGLAPRG
ncbi:MAG: pitrilysin family protein [Hyphomicrobiaceae bacterium]